MELLRARLLALSIILCAFAWAGPAWGDEPRGEEGASASGTSPAYQRHLELGIRLYEDRNYDAAMAEFERAYQAQRRASPLINIALCHKGKFEYVKAIAMLERALRDHRDTVSDPEALEKAIVEMRELLGTVTVRVEPASAKPRLVLDGEPLGAATNEPFPVSPGRHELVTVAEGYAEARTRFRIASGDALTVEVSLETDRGTLVFSSSDADVLVSVDGKRRGKGPVTLSLSPGSHLLELVRDGDRYSATFAIVTGEKTHIALDHNGLLHVGDAGPRGPDAVELPPVTGFYVLTIVDVGPRFGGPTDMRIAPGARLGYRVTTAVGLEAEFHQVFNIIESKENKQVVGTTVGRLNARLMMETLPVRFVTTLGIGYAHDFDEAGSGNGFTFLAEPGVDVELSQVILGLATPIAIGLTSLNGGSLTFDFGGGVRAGYGFW